jgi:hypothetical protein
MSQQNSQTIAAAIKPSASTLVPAQKAAPLPLDPASLRQVSGGKSTPVGAW